MLPSLLFTQTGVDLDVAVLDGGSRDSSLAVVRRYEARLSFWRSAPDRGRAAAINEGIARFPGAAHVGWLNADDVLLPRALERMGAYLDAHPACVAVFGRAHIIDEHGRTIGQFPTRPFERRALARTNIICRPASLVSRRAWDAMGGLDESLYMCLDHDLWWRLSKLGPIAYLPYVVAASRDHEATKTRGHQDRLYDEAFAVLRRHLDYVPWRWCLSESAYAVAGGARRQARQRCRGLPDLRMACREAVRARQWALRHGRGPEVWLTARQSDPPDLVGGHD